jgi:hypothetical protein
LEENLIFLSWNEPFRYLFDIDEVFQKKGVWGKLVNEFITYLKYNSLAPHVLLFQQGQGPVCPAAAYRGKYRLGRN